MRWAVLGMLLAACGPGALPGPGDGGASADAGAAPDAGSPDAGGVPDGGAPDGGPVLHAGVLLGVAGARYVSGSTVGRTGAQGEFQAEDGAQVSFYAGGLLLGTVAPAPLLSAFSLSGSCKADAALRKLLVLLGTVQLASLDASQLAGQSLWTTDLAADLAVLAPGVTPVKADDAIDAFLRVIDSEEWAEESRDSFNTQDSAVRSQGLAWDGAGWLFSWRLGLSRTDAAFAVQKSDSAAIPPAMYVQYGTNHIGDIDVSGGTLYAPMEDGSKYQHPRVGFYDAQSLSFRSSVGLDSTLQPDGVPWVALWEGALVTSAWSNAAELHFFALDGSSAGALPLRPAQTRIQGAKALAGMLYAAEDTDPKKVIKVVLETGTTLDLFTLPGVGEQEGIALSGGKLHTLGSTPDKQLIELRHFHRTRAPLRDQLCK